MFVAKGVFHTRAVSRGTPLSTRVLSHVCVCMYVCMYVCIFFTIVAEFSGRVGQCVGFRPKRAHDGLSWLRGARS